MVKAVTKTEQGPAAGPLSGRQRRSIPETKSATDVGSQERRLLLEITPRNILSFGPETEPIPLRGLNVLVGPNGSGKSNLLDLIALLRSSPAQPGSVRETVQTSGGVAEWVWKGNPNGVSIVDAVLHNPTGTQPLRHILSFRTVNRAFQLEDERIENREPSLGEPGPYFYYHFQHGDPVLNVRAKKRRLERENVDRDLSILAQRRDPETYPEVSYLAAVYGRVQLYRRWSFGRGGPTDRDGRTTPFRWPQPADMPNNRLEEDFSNLGLFLNRLTRTPRVKGTFLEGLQALYEGLTDFHVDVEGGTVQVFLIEGDFTIPASRLSDGTLRYLCLLAILCDPEPPPLICIEEPELGLHPDVLPSLVRLMLRAAERTQLVVTTHSDIIVDALTEHPETVLVCEKHDGQTEIRRLDADRLTDWLQQYRLGQLWTKGYIGGVRW